ncbi:DMT family transporter [Methanospirillum hungatei]|uniref:DMT family transporter n=1 Tax=Methanospirillum hungatei TaxID=2203 RepID=UPI0026EBBC08|nr:DMT family transporter [Methanospirillum hungatei]MCA1915262.1 DMT family transporter [Methanospirillum hungatei]
MQPGNRDAILMALLAAALFGAVIPASRILLYDIGPVTLAGLLYLGAGAGGLVIRRFTNPEGRSEAPIRRTDLPWLLGIIAFGSIIGPILCMVGLTTTPASTASLLLNAELAFTTLIAVIGFREPLGRRGLYAIIAVALGGLVLSYDPAGTFGLSVGSILIILACFCWGLDNNFTRVISGKEPAQIVMIKGFVAGIFSVCLGYAIGEPAPSLIIVPAVLLIGCLGYGVSIFFVIRAMRVLGSARTGALFATAPFIGLSLSLPLPGENPGFQILISLPLMAIGAWLIATEDHDHRHIHGSSRHEHRHSHEDGHHDHHHDPAMKGVVHAHTHEHERASHTHSHTPDLHHFHDHEKGD